MEENLGPHQIPAGVLQGGLDPGMVGSTSKSTFSMSSETAALVERAVGFKVSDFNSVTPKQQPKTEGSTQTAILMPAPATQSSLDDSIAPAIGGGENVAVTTLFNPLESNGGVGASSTGANADSDVKKVLVVPAAHPAHPTIGSRRDVDLISRLDR